MAILSKVKSSNESQVSVSANDNIKNEDFVSLAGLLLREISLRWPSQTAKWQINDAMIESWARGIMDSRVDVRLFGVALTKATENTYPPDLGLLISIAKSGGLDPDDIKRSFYKARQATFSEIPDWHLLTPLEYATAKEFGDVFDLKNAGESDLSRWSKIMSKIHASICASGSKLPNPPPKPTALITEDFRASRNAEVYRDFKCLFSSIERSTKIKIAMSGRGE